MIYYNDCDPCAVAWLKNLVSRGVIAPGDVDTRDIREVQPDDVRGYDQCHFFAGIGGWAEALRLAGWGARPVWTGSCPCQPFSAAGKQKGGADARHLWPEWFRLIKECRPERVFGEQVAGAIGHGWLDLVSTDLEAEGYAIGAVVLGAHSVGAPHIRQRLWFVAESESAGRWTDVGAVRGGALERLRDTQGQDAGRAVLEDGRVVDRGATRLMADPLPAGRHEGRAGTGDGPTAGGGEPRQLGDAASGEQRRPRKPDEGERRQDTVRGSGPWSDCYWLPCRDGKARPVEPGTFPLAHGIPGRVGRLRAYGNAINPYTAAAFIRAYESLT